MQTENFGRNIQLAAVDTYTPECESEVLEILNQNQGRNIRCVGRLHSWSNVIVAKDVLLDLRKLCSVNPVQDGEQKYVDVGAGCQIKSLLQKLQSQKNWTLPSVGFITEQTIAGAISTGTHGSGRHSLSHYVVSIRIACYDSTTGLAIVQEITEGDELLAARCSLGCLGIILSVRMQCRAAYAVEEHFREYKQIEPVLKSEANYPLQQFFFVPWRWTYVVQHRRETLSKPSILLRAYQWYRYLVFDWAMNLLILLCVRVLKSNLSVRTAFRFILPHCVIRNWRASGPSTAQLVMEHELFRHVEIEFFVPKAALPDALAFLKQVLLHAADISPLLESDQPSNEGASRFTSDLIHLQGSYCHHYPICVRKILADDTLISMASSSGHCNETDDRRKTNIASGESGCWYSITLTNYQKGKDRESFEQVVSFLARNMAQRFSARPHWGKLCPLEPTQLSKLYPAFERFRKVCIQHDPNHVFSNRWTCQLLSDSLQQEECCKPGNL